MRFGLLGTGYWAREVHAAALAAHPKVEFVGVWGRDPAKAAALGRRVFATPEDLFAEVDAVAIALPPEVQAGLALRAARAGKHLLLDKPLALTNEAAEAIVTEVEARGLRSLIFFTSRFQPSTNEILDHAMATGGWLGGRALYFGAIGADSPYAESLWRKEYGGLWDLGPHALSLLLPVLGPVAEVSAVSGPRQTTYVTLQHENGAVSTMGLTLNAPPEAGRIEVELHGDAGWLAVPGFDGDAVASFGRAISQLLSGQTQGLDVHFGREVVAILALAAKQAR